MAELEARSKTDGSKTWRLTLPGTPVLIGRDGPDLWGAAPWDKQISRVHATLHWQNGRLLVRRRTAPTRTTNPIFFNGREIDEFTVGPGEHFVIGETTFAVHDDAPRPTQLTVGRDDALQLRFDDPGRRIDALALLPDLIRQTADEEELAGGVLQVLLQGIPHATAAAVVSVEEPEGGGEPKVVVRAARRRPGPGRPAEFSPSRGLVLAAVRRERKTVGHVFTGDARAEGSRHYTVPDKTDWAICSPLPDEPTPGWALYLAGQLPRPILSSASAAGDPEVNGDIKFTFLTAEFFGSLRQILDLRRREARLTMFFSRSVLKAFAGRDTDALLREREAPVTVLFCDLRGSCRIAEGGKGNLHQLWAQVGEALRVMTRYIIYEDGVIGDFQGDSALGFWGWPFDQPDQVERAARAALAIQREFAMRGRDPADPLARFSCGIGLAHGPAIAGRIGTPDQFKVGVFGPVVNLAVRLESMTKQLGAPVLIDEAMAAALGPPGPRYRQLARVLPYGMDTPIAVGELLPPPREPGSLPEGARRDFEIAAGHFQNGRWGDACEKLRRLTDGPSRFLVQYMTRHPDGPPADWDGVVRLEAK
jgi:adenylate cyclase